MLTGHVHVWNDTGSLRSNRLVIHYETGTDTVDYLTAHGDVRLRTEELFARGSWAYQDVTGDTVLLREDAYVRRGDDHFLADQMFVNLATSSVSMDEDVRGQFSTRSGLFRNEP